VRVAPLSPETAAAWTALFEACGCACYCRYWHFSGGKNDWLARSFERPQESRDEQLVGVAEGSMEARGLVAFDGEMAVGWMKLAPRSILVKLRRQGAYRSLDLGSDDDVWSIGCFLVHPKHRRRGVARALVQAADEHVRRWGGHTLEAYPHRAGYALRDEEAWMGPHALLVSCGYVTTHEDGPYPVYRRAL
jgi:GNAT superfamily N-acetyltransferase